MEAKMRVVVRGWSRDHGEKIIMNTDELDDMPVAPENIKFESGETYLQVERRILANGKEGSWSPKVHVWADTKLNLSGWYQTHLELDRREIGRLFYLAYGHRELDDIGRVLASFKDEEERRAAAITVPKEDARKAIVAQWLRLPTTDRANEVQAFDFAMQAMERYSWRVSAGAYHEAVGWLSPHVGKP
jgi:hypothetical protein